MALILQGSRKIAKRVLWDNFRAPAKILRQQKICGKRVSRRFIGKAPVGLCPLSSLGMAHGACHFRAPAQLRSRCVGRGAARFPPREKRRRKRKQLELAQAVSKCALRRRGGDNETRTRDLYVANVSRYQLCYIPMQFAALRRITRFHRHP